MISTEDIYNLAIVVNCAVFIAVLLISQNITFICITTIAMIYLTRVEANMYRKSTAANKEKG